ncbi:DUF2141 domain-containing protein [Hymenobacter busanensis]|uniref:DUF2141 domain-containing protein n=1 Tax=Hymenobacter busanensis TaxID=2607656 RepID=A0AA88JXZ7_9BACT|nr:DUF2141 domain-containing protein [Hymenobacter busanensis]KAA9325104.1 DUF2141 domain-containing protein [Hymenobacter busanensis]
MSQLAATLLSAAFLSLGATPIPEPTAVSVVITNLPSNKATLKLYFYNVKENFLVRNHYTLLKHIKPGGSNKVVYPIQLPPGNWAIAVTQDLNENDLVDRNMLGIPTEPFALSNNVKPRFKIPTFEECMFRVSGPTTTVAITMK